MRAGSLVRQLPVRQRSQEIAMSSHLLREVMSALIVMMTIGAVLLLEIRF